MRKLHERHLLEELIGHRAPRQTVPRVLWRFVTGRPLNGWSNTDAPFFRPATQIREWPGRSSKWAMMAGWQRAAVRLGTLAGAITTLTGYIVAPRLTVSLLTAITVTAAGYGAWRFYNYALNYQHERK